MENLNQNYLIEAYQYLNTLDSRLLSLIPDNVWQYFENNIDMSKVKIVNKEITISDKAKELVDYIKQTYIYI